MVKMNNEMHQVTKEDIGEQVWELLKYDMAVDRENNHDKKKVVGSCGVFVRLGKRYFVKQNSTDPDDIEVFQYESLYH